MMFSPAIYGRIFSMRRQRWAGMQATDGRDIINISSIDRHLGL